MSPKTVACVKTEPHKAHDWDHDTRENPRWHCMGRESAAAFGLDAIAKAADPNAPRDPDAPMSLLEHRFDLVDAPALFEMTGILYTGAKKYGEDNWRKIAVEAHLNHLIAHAYAYLSGDRTDDHLGNIMCRAMFAKGKAMRPEIPGKADGA